MNLSGISERTRCSLTYFQNLMERNMIDWQFFFFIMNEMKLSLVHNQNEIASTILFEAEKSLKIPREFFCPKRNVLNTLSDTF